MKFRILAALAVLLPLSSKAQVIITQYYEGPSTNKWIEITNVGTGAFNLATLALGQWNNANAEGYKTGAAPSFTFNLSGSLASGASALYGNTGNTSPTYAVAATTAPNNTVINFNGNDSMVLYTTGTYSLAKLVDAVGFTNSGNEGADKSFIRTSTSVGWSTVSGSDVTDFSSVWTLATNTAVINAAAGVDSRLGYSSLSISAVPEPSTYAAIFGGLALVGAVIHRRRKAAKQAA